MTARLRLGAVARELRRLEGFAGRRARTLERIRTLAALVERADPAQRELSLSAVVEVLFAGSGDGVARFRDFRSDLHNLAQTHDSDLRCHVDGQKHAPPEARLCWFTGTPEGARRIEDLSNQHVRVHLEKQSGMQRNPAVAVAARARRAVRVCIDGHIDDPGAADLTDRLRRRLLADREFEVEVSDTLELVATSPSRDALTTHADVVICFLGRNYLDRRSPPKHDGVPLVSVALVDEARETTPDFNTPFSLREEAYQDAAPDEFVQVLHVKIDALLASGGRTPWDSLLDEQIRYFTDADALHLGKTVVDVQRHLMGWAANPEGRPYLVIFGEYGMGKTTACNLFTRTLLNARDEDPTAPLPIYLDLRRLAAGTKNAPTRDAILTDLLVTAWQLDRAEGTLVAKEIVELVQNQGAIAILDGLDEVLVHLEESVQREFLKQLLSILPPDLVRDPTANAGAGRLLLTCRTHFFRTLRDQYSYLLEGARGPDESLYDSLNLLPFNDRQVTDFLKGVAAPRGMASLPLERAVSLIHSTRELAELVRRPLSLSLVAGRLPEIERRVADGARMDSAALYEEVLSSRLDWDDGKHVLRRDDKLRLMEDLAAEMWRHGVRALTADELERWLNRQLLADDDLGRWRQASDEHLDSVAADLRNATFIVRPGQTAFEFAHTSLLEYFLARRLARALAESDIAVWSVPTPSPETFDFLGQIIRAGDARRCLDGLRAIRSTYRPEASEAAFAYCVRALASELPGLPLIEFDLEGASLKGLTISANPRGPDISLVRCRLAGADLSDARFEGVRVTHCDLSDARLARAEFHRGRFTAITVDGADLTSVIVRESELARVDLRRATAGNTQWINCTFQDVSWPSDGEDHIVAPPQEGAGTARAPDRGQAELRSFAGHSGGVWSVTVSPDGSRVASGGADGTIRVWEAQNWAPICRLDASETEVWSVSISPDGRMLASASNDGTVRIWDLETGESARHIEKAHEGGVRSVAYGPSGSRLVSSGADGTACVWDADSGDLLARIDGHEEGAHSAAFAPDETQIATVGGDGSLSVWEADTGKPLAQIVVGTGRVSAVAYSPDGRWLAAAGADGIVRILPSEPTDASDVLELAGHIGQIWHVAFSPDSDRLASAGDDGTLRIWDVESGQPVARIDGHSGGVRQAAYGRDGQWIASAGADGTVRLWDAVARAQIRRLDGHGGGIWSVAFSRDGEYLVTGGSDGIARIWNVHTGTQTSTMEGHRGGVWSSVFTADRRFVLTASEDGELSKWEVASGQKIAGFGQAPGGHASGVRSVSLSPDGVLAATGGADRMVRIWNLDEGTQQQELAGHEGGVREVSFLNSAERVASVSADGTVRIWDVLVGEEIQRLGAQNGQPGHVGGIRSVSFARDGKTLATAGDDGMIHIWDDAGRHLRRAEGHVGGIRYVTHSPDSTHLASAGSDGSIRIWDVETAEQLLRLRGHIGNVRSVSYAPDGLTLASVGADATLRVWDAGTGDPIFVAHVFERGEYASFIDDKATACSPEAWRWLGWWGQSPATGTWRRYPAEMFGPLPVIVDRSEPAEAIG